MSIVFLPPGLPETSHEQPVGIQIMVIYSGGETDEPLFQKINVVVQCIGEFCTLGHTAREYTSHLPGFGEFHGRARLAGKAEA